MLRSEAYFQPLCEDPAIATLKTILYSQKLNYSEKVLKLALLLEPGYRKKQKDGSFKTEPGTLAHVARHIGANPASVTRWLKRCEALTLI